MMKLNVISFGMLTEITGNQFSVTAIDTQSLKEEIMSLYPQLSGMKFAIAVNQKIVHEPIPLSESDEIALMPPYSGG